VKGGARAGFDDAAKAGARKALLDALLRHL
jgi:hypothetical protein